MRVDSSAAVLAGGRSSRMGEAKARLAFGGEPLLARVVRPLRALFDDVFIVGGEQDTGLPVWPDLVDGGPLAGVLTALAHAQHPYCLVVACDMPFLSAPLLRWMTELADGFDAVAPRDERGWHPLHAIYARSAAPRLEERLQSGARSIQPLLDTLNVREITSEEVARFARPGRHPLQNLNTPADLAAARQALTGDGAPTP